MELNYLDVALAVPLLWGCYKGFTKGLIIEVASLLALALGIYGGLKCSNFAAEMLQSHVELNAQLLPIVSFAVTFIAVVIAIYSLAKMAEKLIDLAALKLVNKLFGLVFGMLKIALILSVLILMIGSLDQKLGLIPKELKQNSVLYEPIGAIAPIMIPALKELTKKVKENVLLI